MFENKIIKITRNQRGQGLTEYGMILSVVSIAAVATLTFFGDIIIDTFYVLITDAFASI